MEIKAFFLKSFDLATGMSDAELYNLGSIARQKESRKGQTVYSKGAEDKKVFLLVSGKIKIAEINDSGNEMIKEVLVPGDLFGDLTPVETRKFEYAEVISERASFLVFDFNQFQQVIKDNHVLALNFLRKVSEKFERLENRYVNMISLDVKSRLLYCFKDWAMKEGRKLGNKVIIKNYLTHNEIANLISTSRQTVTIILNELKQSGEINYSRREIEMSEILLAS